MTELFHNPEVNQVDDAKVSTRFYKVSTRFLQGFYKRVETG